MRWGNLEVAVFTKERQVNPQVGQWERLPPILSSMVPISNRFNPQNKLMASSTEKYSIPTVPMLISANMSYVSRRVHTKLSEVNVHIGVSKPRR